MRKLITIATLLLMSVAYGQKKSFTYKLQGIKTVKIDTDTKVKITASGTNELIIKEKGYDNHCGDCEHDQDKHHKSLKEKTKGLKAIYPGGEDSTDGMGFSIEKSGNVLNIVDLLSHVKRNNLFITLPKNINIIFDTPNLGAVEVIGFTSEVEAKTNVGAIVMKDVTGPITVNANAANVNIEFSKVNQSSPITIFSNVGEIDVTIPENTKANLDLRTRGTFYTNFDIEMPKKDGLKAVRGSQKISSALNNGGVQIKLKSTMGNIYLRKK
ncbi:hypothetical protein [uncultured Tenacibaculum sp.]|uniref:hypothetical protein n=1 Tax=uncultured Tenacibaculum sp. TaxID=174713 RepID=UPI002634C862|nr:hypothetical protein [uncultured Tenacibaculum sp.]